MTNQVDPSPLAELAMAFGDTQKQEDASREQNTQEGVDTNPDTSSSPDGTTPSSTTDTPTKDSILESLSIDEIKAHPTLGRLFQSAVDSTAAGMLRGKEQEIRRKVDFDVAKRHFESLTPDQLRDELLNPEAAKLYGLVVSQTPSAVDPNQEAAKQYYTREIVNTKARIAAAGLDEETTKSLDPSLHLLGAGNPDDLLAAWKTKVDDTIVDHKVSKAVGKTSATDSKSKELDNQADNLKPTGAVMQNGRRSTPLPDFDKHSGMALLSDAFERTTRR